MPLQLEIVTPERLAYSDEVDMVLVPGVDGELGILPHHAPLVSLLGLGADVVPCQQGTRGRVLRGLPRFDAWHLAQQKPVR